MEIDKRVNHIQGLHAIIQQLIDQGKMPISDTIQKYVGNSRAQLRAVQKELIEAKPSASDNNESDAIAIVKELGRLHMGQDYYTLLHWLSVLKQRAHIS